MVTEERKKEILKGLHDRVVAFEEDNVAELSQAATFSSVFSSFTPK